MILKCNSFRKIPNELYTKCEGKIKIYAFDEKRLYRFFCVSHAPFGWEEVPMSEYLTYKVLES